MDAQIGLIAKALASTEEQVAFADKERRKIEAEMNEVEINIMKLHTESKNLYGEYLHAKSESTTLLKTVVNLDKQSHQIAIDIEDKSIELENVLNEIARVKIDQLNTTSQLDVLQGKKKEVEKEREQKELTIVVYETQIHTGHDLNEKKQHEVGRLNKVHDQLTSNQQDGSSGPLEAAKNSLKKKIERTAKETESVNREWIRKQEIFVLMNEDIDKVEHHESSQRTKKVILEQKRLRIMNHHAQREKEIVEIQIGLKNLQNEMKKLNDALFINKEKRTKLENENFNVESEFIQKLKYLEKDSVRLELEIDSLKEEKVIACLFLTCQGAAAARNHGKREADPLLGEKNPAGTRHARSARPHGRSVGNQRAAERNPSHGAASRRHQEEAGAAHYGNGEDSLQARNHPAQIPQKTQRRQGQEAAGAGEHFAAHQAQQLLERVAQRNHPKLQASQHCHRPETGRAPASTLPPLYKAD